MSEVRPTDKRSIRVGITVTVHSIDGRARPFVSICLSLALPALLKAIARQAAQFRRPCGAPVWRKGSRKDFYAREHPAATASRACRSALSRSRLS